VEVEVVEELRRRHPGLRAPTKLVRNVRVHKSNPELEKAKRRLEEEIRRRFRLETLKDEHPFREYRDFFWKIGIDPTKIRPAGEALVRRILRGNPLPRINTAVDSYNMASAETGIAIAAFDADRLHGVLVMREARPGEEFLGIGMDKPITLKGGEIVLHDGVEVVAVYPYRDGEETKITEETRNVLVVSCGVPGIPVDELLKALDLASEYISRFCGAGG